jgi:chromosome partitioning protein
MRTIAIVNQKGGVGKTTTTVNLGAALALAGQRVLLIDLDPQANLSMHLGLEAGPNDPSIYGVLVGSEPLADAIRPTGTPGLSIVASNIDLSGAELELASALGRETLLRDAVDSWRTSGGGEDPVDFVLFDCPPSLGLLSINGLAAAREVFIALQTEFFALQGTSKLVEVVQLLQRRINPELLITGIVPCLYDSRLRLAREVLAEIRKYFPGQVFGRGIGTNVKLAEAPSYGQTIFEYAPESKGAKDHELLAQLVLEQSGAAPAPGAGEAHGELRPTSPPAAVTNGEPKPRIVRAEDLPELPTEAFRAPATD